MASLYKKPVIIRDTKTGQRVKTRSRKWWGRFRDATGQEKRVPLPRWADVAVKGLRPRPISSPAMTPTTYWLTFNCAAMLVWETFWAKRWPILSTTTGVIIL